jgi:hypothetical protein
MCVVRLGRLISSRGFADADYARLGLTYDRHACRDWVETLAVGVTWPKVVNGRRVRAEGGFLW